jgi:hypothetical protein
MMERFYTILESLQDSISNEQVAVNSEQANGVWGQSHGKTGGSEQ